MEGVISTQCASFVEHAGRWHGMDIIVIEAGDTWQQVARAVTDLINMHHPSWVISAGFASSLSKRVRRNDCDAQRDSRRQRSRITGRVSARRIKPQAGLLTGDLVSTPEVLTTPAKRKELASQFRTEVADMESAVVAEICRQARQRCMAIRIVAEDFDDQPPELMSRIMKQGSFAAKFGAFSKGLFTQASQLKGNVGLKNEAYKSSELGWFSGGCRAAIVILW